MQWDACIEIANQIINKQADYVLALKGNQGKLYGQVSGWFKQARKQATHSSIV